MPIITIKSPLSLPKDENLLKDISVEVTRLLEISSEHCWITWMETKVFYKKDWESTDNPAPIVHILCKESHKLAKVHKLLRAIQELIAESEACDIKDIYISIQKLEKGNILVRDEIWGG
ncbi:hypothetical protein PQ478_19600 [Alkalihalophilus pseudofirmus]|uniref:hypothetical protein n=1 Tax=Alkalihalophilus pseudofirmus TaxID=79885 RepID=UPI00259AFA19|nr:hypothetical protein [Alkalihalophilus pseudofirmus]WEG16684.1 hypothetical protein PQ478_19600 [Alkalihalophilus pseudofirmus]